LKPSYIATGELSSEKTDAFYFFLNIYITTHSHVGFNKRRLKTLSDPNNLKEQKWKIEKRIETWRHNKSPSEQTQELWLPIHTRSLELLEAVPPVYSQMF
jgi:hypothetical protein